MKAQRIHWMNLTYLHLNQDNMRNNKIKINPYLSGTIEKSKLDVNYGVSVNKGPVTLDVNQSAGNGYMPETNINLSVSIPITKKLKNKRKKI